MKKEKSFDIGEYYKKAIHPLLILRLLENGPQYGYEIAKEINRIADKQFSIKTVYPLLKKLEEKGFVTSECIISKDNKARTYYTITEQGSRYELVGFGVYLNLHNVFCSAMAYGNKK